MPNISLPRCSPERQGMSSNAVLSFLDSISEKGIELHSFMLLRHGYVIAEGWWKPYAPHLNHSLFSLSKSFTATAIGMAVDENLLTIDDHVIDFFPDKLPPVVDDHLKALTIKDLLTMSTGHDQDTLEDVHPGQDWVKNFLATPLKHKPGTVFVYNTPATYMLSAILQTVTGEKLIDFLRPRLFEPLGIENPTWEVCPMGINTGGYGLSITTEDIAKFGQLFLDHGQWQGRQLISPQWIAQASSLQISNFQDDPNSDWQQGYGYQMWMCRHGVYRGDGAFGQFCIVMPDQDAVVAITSGTNDMQGVMNSVWDHILPAFEDQLPEDAAAHQRLQDRLADLSLDILPGFWDQQAADNIAGQSYVLEDNQMGLTKVEFAVEDQSLLITVHGQGVITTTKCGFGHYLEHPNDWEGLVLACSTWKDPNTLITLTRAVETPFSRVLTMRFSDDELVLDMKQNCNFGPLEYPTMKGHLVGRNQNAGTVG